MSEVCEVPVLSSTTTLTVTETPQTLEDMGLELDANLDLIRVIFEGLWQLQEIARYARDPGASISATVGNPIYPFAKICLNEFETGALFRTVSGTLEITVEQYECIAVCDFQAEYRGAITKLLPIGWAWEAKTNRSSNLFKLLNVIGKIASDLHCRALELTCEFYAGECKELCDNWADEAFDKELKDCLQGFSLTEQERLNAVITRILARGSYRPDDFIEVAAALGLTVTVTDDAANFRLIFDFIAPDIEPMTACDLACARMHDGPDMNSMLAFMCIMNKIGPAQSDMVFTIDGDCEAVI